MDGSKSLDVDGVRAFVLVADLASFTRAAEALDVAQAAISLRVKRLEALLGYRLLERTPRFVRLSQGGLGFIGPARAFLEAHERAVVGDAAVVERRLKIGISDHVAGPDLPAILAKFRAYDPALVLEVYVATSRVLLDDFERGRLDAAIIRRDGGMAKGKLLFEDAVGWFAASTFEQRTGERLRLANLAPPCGVRTMAIKALEQASMPWREVFVGGGLLAVGAAVSAGLAVAALASRLAPPGAVEVGKKLKLPPLPPSQVAAHVRPGDAKSQSALRTLIAAFCASTAR
jgi:DNA-binding transcriptional LysR family regulator